MGQRGMCVTRALLSPVHGPGRRSVPSTSKRLSTRSLKLHSSQLRPPGPANLMG